MLGGRGRRWGGAALGVGVAWLVSPAGSWLLVYLFWIAIFEVDAPAFKAEKKRKPVRADSTATQSFAHIKSLGKTLPYLPTVLDQFEPASHITFMAATRLLRTTVISSLGHQSLCLARLSPSPLATQSPFSTRQPEGA